MRARTLAGRAAPTPPRPRARTGCATAARLADGVDAAVAVSLAGRTGAPAAHAGQVRIGGFAGAEGLGQYLTAARVDALVDATHPYAAIISANAADAAAATRVALLALR